MNLTSSAKVWCSVFLALLMIDFSQAITSSPKVRVCESGEGCTDIMPHPSFSVSHYEFYRECVRLGRPTIFCSYNWAEDLGYWVCLSDACAGFEGAWIRNYRTPNILNMGKIRAAGNSVGYKRRREELFPEQ